MASTMKNDHNVLASKLFPVLFHSHFCPHCLIIIIIIIMLTTLLLNMKVEHSCFTDGSVSK